MVSIESPSYARVQEFPGSQAYAEVKALRLVASPITLVAVDGAAVVGRVDLIRMVTFQERMRHPQKLRELKHRRQTVMSWDLVRQERSTEILHRVTRSGRPEQPSASVGAWLSNGTIMTTNTNVALRNARAELAAASHSGRL